ncbi:MAG: GWxTD domain-containing protein [Candidatus Aminicenantes bacterium]|nr:GWxTD domain-containing protein [Candidatus Aminicenantes bacterium]NIM84460.1 GWxTD domain-containing protein [Candidatus Aminicenantes bacterium]NIN23981.1 GWxTD domain-containing protein [Candidatus Aminicenantes bacterium]NIN47695.1 GWxTD domain-containing protein [Candidatus Aminicenantes bacterium]NIN90625.1 GWxTD domain-containing protein [Candidatus Aminicenantes bacterium]
MTNKKKYYVFVSPLLGLVLLGLTLTLAGLSLNFCSQSRSLIKDLPADDQEFLSTVRYIITRAEKKKFLSLTSDTERREFRIKFWQKRDPDPSTKENEFKTQYFKRIEEADRHFTQGKLAGSLTDRGRVYILIGPPDTRRIYPTGYSFYDFPSEVWIYGFFPIIFIDRTFSGDYQLTPLGARYIAEINKAQIRDIPKVKTVSTPFAFKLKLMRNKKTNQYFLRILMPYRNIVFLEGPDGYSAAITANIQVLEVKKKIRQSLDKTYTITVKAEELELLKKDYIIDIPVNLEAGKYEVTAIIENKEEKVKVRDKITFKI